MTTLNKNDKKFFLVCGLIVIILILIISVMSGLNNKNNKNKKNKNGQYLSLDKNENAKKILVENGKFSDDICGITFEIPSGMVKSLISLPLPQKPLSQAVFDDEMNKSVFSFICYDGKYTFDQFKGDGDLKTETLTVGGKNFSRTGNFVYFNKGGKLIIFQMFFTKNDVEVKNGYEEKLSKILGSVN